MSENSDSTPKSTRNTSIPPKSDVLSDELWSITSESLKVGLAGGVTGFIYGGAAGILSGGRRGLTPRLLAISSGIHAFAISTTFWGVRTALHREARLQTGLRRDEDLINTSLIAGAVAGGVSTLIRGRTRAAFFRIPIFALLGATGQYAYNWADARQLEKSLKPAKPTSHWTDSKWSPVKVLTDEEYESMLREKLLKINVEIALVDDNIQRINDEAALKRQTVATEEAGNK